MSKLFCVVVSFNPCLEYFKKVLLRILDNDVSVIVVDNGSDNLAEIIDALPISVTLLDLGENVGIAKAQNLGAKNAFDAGADYIWLSDQDTLYPSDFAFKMLEVVSKAEEDGVVFGAIGPTFFELNRQRVEPFVKFAPWGRRFSPDKGLNKVAHLIASGMIISKKSFQAIGPKREDLFIDWVDLEWCWRANAKGYQVYGTGDVEIQHNLGDLMVKVANKQISIRSPFRHYFIIRNGMYLCLHYKLLPFGARLHYLLLTLVTSMVYPVLAPSNKWEHLKVNALALWHGLIGRLGSKP